MPILKGPVPAGSYQDSIARVEMFTDAALAQDDWRVVFHFETGAYDPAGKLVGATQFGSMRVERRFGDIKADPDLAALIAMIKAKGYAWRAEDIAAAAVKPPEKPPGFELFGVIGKPAESV